VRKDLAHWSQVPHDVAYFFDPAYSLLEADARNLFSDLDPACPAEMLRDIAAEYDQSRSRDDWLEWLRAIGARYSYAPNMKAFKADKDAFRGHFGDIAAALRIILAGRRNTPDLYEIMQVMAAGRVRQRIEAGMNWSAA
jgi:glutamyl-tRNA synthetase